MAMILLQAYKVRLPVTGGIPMLDRAVVTDLLKDWMNDSGIKLPRDIKFKELVEAFCQFAEDDYYEWLKDNYESFFSDGKVDWDEMKDRIAKLNAEEDRIVVRKRT